MFSKVNLYINESIGYVERKEDELYNKFITFYSYNNLLSTNNKIIHSTQTVSTILETAIYFITITASLKLLITPKGHQIINHQQQYIIIPIISIIINKIRKSSYILINTKLYK